MSDEYPDNHLAMAEVVLPATDLSETLRFFIDELGFRMDSIAPADDPQIAQLSGFGLNLRLDSNHQGEPGMLRLSTSKQRSTSKLTAPNGTTIQFAPTKPPLQMPALQPSLTIQRLAGNNHAWKTGRAGMLYRDLIPDRQGGCFIASHIRIPEGGPVPDNVHYHDIRFQMIYCYRGWVRLVYEDQGDPFVMQAGDCVLQPPLIRHRVLEASDGLEVIEIGNPASHMTYLDHDMPLPTDEYKPERNYQGQQYTFHQADKAVWCNGLQDQFEVCDLGISAATNGLASVRVIRHKGITTSDGKLAVHHQALAFWFVLQGQLLLSVEQQADNSLSTGDSFVVPQGLGYALTKCSSDLELLEVCLPE